MKLQDLESRGPWTLLRARGLLNPVVFIWTIRLTILDCSYGNTFTRSNGTTYFAGLFFRDSVTRLGLDTSCSLVQFYVWRHLEIHGTVASMEFRSHADDQSDVRIARSCSLIIGIVCTLCNISHC